LHRYYSPSGRIATPINVRLSGIFDFAIPLILNGTVQESINWIICVRSARRSEILAGKFEGSGVATSVMAHPALFHIQ
jgi:hypothetical protein